MKSLQETQLEFIQYLRKSTSSSNDPDVGRRKSIYRDLVKNNINRIISDSFPISKTLIADHDWNAMIDGFITNHQSQTPYFLEICQEFLVYLNNERTQQTTDQPFMLELAHFEWIVLAMDIADINLHSPDPSKPTAESLYTISPLVLGLTYQYPVHLINDEYLPTPINPTQLLVYRDRHDQVRILETDDLTLRIVQILQAHENLSYQELFNLLSAEIPDTQTTASLEKIPSILLELREKDMVFIEA